MPRPFRTAGRGLPALPARYSPTNANVLTLRCTGPCERLHPTANRSTPPAALSICTECTIPLPILSPGGTPLSEGGECLRAAQALNTEFVSEEAGHTIPWSKARKRATASGEGPASSGPCPLGDMTGSLSARPRQSAALPRRLHCSVSLSSASPLRTRRSASLPVESAREGNFRVDTEQHKPLQNPRRTPFSKNRSTISRQYSPSIMIPEEPPGCTFRPRPIASGRRHGRAVMESSMALMVSLEAGLIRAPVKPCLA